ncbi:putative efflux protein, MATE family [Paenibacillus sp. UNCCL117]|uniref:MATE family efflux transporter n=1 Tax=unclassified Paenibacillus TaxID=185978 RepID=UPI000880CCA9|nr:MULTISPECIES: MATE family efflux transporter [unclassified Paenibacillus]SDC24529.1 putative efflux protein, MATE family [Paenibacillus sp. cl123]SFW19583.1 putative efflux protein, MATE family [Paenibacillus sp. UNCCL117]
MTNLLTEETPAWKKLSLLAVTWPIFIDSLLRMMLGTADVFMLSRISDQVAGAIGLANEMIVFCILMFGFVGIGTSVAVTQYLGAGRRETATRIAAIAITMNLIFGILVSLALVLFSRLLLELMHLDASLIEQADRYLKIIGGFIWIEALSYAISSVIRANGQTRDVMFVTLGVNVLHIIGNYLLIFGHLGFPEWGVTGAAVSAVASRLIGLIVLVGLLYRRMPVRIRPRDYINFDKVHVRQILGIGLPSAGEHLSWQSQHMMVMVFITMIGPAALSAHVYVYNISAYFMALAAAIGMGTEIVIGHMIGAGELKAAYRRLLRSLRISLGLTFAIVCVAALFREKLMGLFTVNPEIIAMGTGILLLSIILEPGRTFNLVVINSLRAAGDARFPVLMGILSMWGICVPLAYWLGIHLDMGLLGVWIAFTVDEWLRGLIMLLRWRSRVWERKALVKPAGHAGHAGQETVIAG